MPVVTSVVVVASLFVSSGSKIALFGSTVTVFVIVPRVGGATTRNRSVLAVGAGIAPPVQVTTLLASTEQTKPPSCR